MANFSAAAPATQAGVSRHILGAISLTHAINDMMQSVLMALYPLLQGRFRLSFVQIGLITLVFQFSASLLQPVVGHVTDRKPRPYSLPMGMGATMLGLILLAVAWDYPVVLVSAALVGVGSSVFHPEASRIARLASAGQHGLAQSIFQMGGTMGTAIGPLLAAMLILPLGQFSVLAVSMIALVGIAILLHVSRWSVTHMRSSVGRAALAAHDNGLSPQRVRLTLLLLMLLLFSKFAYVASLSSYFTFYLMERFGVTAQSAQYCLFVFLLGTAIGTLIGGPLSDRIGRQRIILISILGAAPFTLLLPHVGLIATIILVFIVGLILASAFPAIVVYGQELMPGKTGTISGLFFGLAFGFGGLGAAAIGTLADIYSIEWVYQLCAGLPLLGLVALGLPDMRRKNAA